MLLAGSGAPPSASILQRQQPQWCRLGGYPGLGLQDMIFSTPDSCSLPHPPLWQTGRFSLLTRRDLLPLMCGAWHFPVNGPAGLSRLKLRIGQYGNRPQGICLRKDAWLPLPGYAGFNSSRPRATWQAWPVWGNGRPVAFSVAQSSPHILPA